jgi:hypothetical protein
MSFHYIYHLQHTDVGATYSPRYDYNSEAVVIARDSKVARKVCAATLKGDEGPNFWLNTVYTSCRKIGVARSPNGHQPKERVICASFHAG